LWQSSCGGGDLSTDGYLEGAGRFGPLLFDPSGEYLLFSEIRECRRVLGEPSRLLAYELSSGITRVLLETEKQIEINASGAGLAVYVDRAAEHLPSDAHKGQEHPSATSAPRPFSCKVT
jgi:hypothetical protein